MFKTIAQLILAILAVALPDAALASSNEYKESIPEWIDYTDKGNFKVGIDKQEKHSGASSAYLKSLTAKSKEFGNLMQAFVPNDFWGKRLRMTAWVKTKLTSGTAQLWVRVDGEWKTDTKSGCFDNMNDRPIKGDTDWTKYSVVVDVPQDSDHVWFGLMLIGTGQIWLDDVTMEAVGKGVPLTGGYTTSRGCGKKEPLNLGFESKG